MISNFDAQS